MDEQARQIFAEAYATIERVEKMTTEIIPNRDVPVEKSWGSPEYHRRQVLDMEQDEQQEDPQTLNNWADTKIAAALDRFSEEYSENVINIVFTRMEKHKKAAQTEINQLKTQVAELRGEVNLLRELLKGNVKDIRPTAVSRKDIA
jgi:hypothetical protein